MIKIKGGDKFNKEGPSIIASEPDVYGSSEEFNGGPISFDEACMKVRVMPKRRKVRNIENLGKLVEVRLSYYDFLFPKNLMQKKATIKGSFKEHK